MGFLRNHLFVRFHLSISLLDDHKIKNILTFLIFAFSGDRVRQPDLHDGHVRHHPHHHCRPRHGGGGHPHGQAQVEVSVVATGCSLKLSIECLYKISYLWIFNIL